MGAFLTNRWAQGGFLFFFLLVSVAFNFSNARWRDQIRNFTFDNYNIATPREASDAVVIVDIDEASLKAVGQMPWSRTVMADMVKKLRDMGAAVIAFDIVFSEPDRSSPAFLVKTLEGVEGLQDFVEIMRGLPDNDALFGETLQGAGNVVTGFSFTNEETGFTPTQKGIFRGKDVERFIKPLPGAVVNLKEIGKGAAGNGSFFVSTDTDGIIRRVPMLVAHGLPGSKIMSVYPSLSLEAVRVYEGERGGRVDLEDSRYAEMDRRRFGIKGITVGRGGTFIPTNAHGELMVYFSRSNPAWYVPAHKILDGSYPAEKLKGKIVLIGTSAVGLKDIRSTPLDTFIAGVEVHHNIIDQILQKKFLSRPVWVEGMEALTILLVGLFIIIFSSFIGAEAQALAVAVIVTAFVFTGQYAFINRGILVDVTYPSFCVVALFMLSTVLTYLRAEKARKAIKQAFGLYISPEFMAELTKNPEKLRLGGENRELTVMFSDIRKFTTIAERMKPEALIQLMNDFLTPMSDIVVKNRGTIDKYIGDAMMAFWNAPLDEPDHARHACRTALAIQEALVPVNEALAAKQKAEGREPVLLKAGIGLNTGVCAVGNMGSKQRFAYSVLGDAVNLASRLEGQTKNYEVNIIIGESTWEKAQDFAALEADLIQVKGRTQATRIFVLLGDEKMAVQEQFLKLKDVHERMIAAYRSGDFKKAMELIAECAALQSFGLEGFYEIYAGRIETLLKNPPEKWDGVFVAKDK